MNLSVLGIDEETALVYRTLLQSAQCDLAALSALVEMPEQDVQTRLDRLTELALIQRSAKGKLYVPVNPGVAVEALLSIQQADLSRRQQDLMQARAELARLVDGATGRTTSSRQVERLDDPQAVVQILTQLSEQCRDEVLSAVPEDSQETRGLAASRRADLELVRRGVRCRLLYTPGHLAVPEYREYITDLSAAGAAVRVAAHIPQRLVIFDRAVCFLPVPAADGRHGALVVRDRGIIDNFGLLFDSFWSHASSAESESGRTTISEVDRRILILMSSGVKDESAARQLNVSHRTYRRHVADLMQELGSDSRFQAGVEAVRRGWL